jgi:recombination protein RecT
MSTQTISSAVAIIDNSPRALVQKYTPDFTAVLPSHIKPETWVRLAAGALKKGKKNTKGQTDLEIAAANNPGAFLAALLDAARLGLEPGTEQYYLTPRDVKNADGKYQSEILGIVGYQGHIELMYRAGAISSVVAECVYTNDTFSYRPGRDERPIHDVDWDSADRGALRLVYAYAVMKDGATSKVVVLNKAAIATIKGSAKGSDGKYSPWQVHEASMWLKSAVRQLQKWVPTSSEYIREQLRAVAEVQAETVRSAPAAVAPEPSQPLVDHRTGEVLDAELLDDTGVDSEPAGWDAA